VALAGAAAAVVAIAQRRADAAHAQRARLGSAVLVEPAERQHLPLWRWVEHDIQIRAGTAGCSLTSPPLPGLGQCVTRQY
jgi:hypothetical protein